MLVSPVKKTRFQPDVFAPTTVSFCNYQASLSPPVPGGGHQWGWTVSANRATIGWNLFWSDTQQTI